MKRCTQQQVEGTLTTLEMIQREGRAPEIDFVTAGPEAEVLDELVRELGAMRALLRPPVEARLDDRAPLRVVHEPAMTVGRTHAGDLLLAVRHPGFGWLTFSVSEEGRMYLLEALETL